MPRYRRHVLLTVLPLGLLFLLGVARAWPALRGAESYAVAVSVSWTGLVVGTVVALASLGVYIAGWSRLSVDETEGAGPYRSSGCLRLQKLAGGVAWGLVVTHVIVQWTMTTRVGPVAISQYELLRQLLSQPAALGVYVLGLSAFGLYLSQGVAAAFRAWGVGARPESSLRVEVGGTLLGAVMVLIGINVLSHFATGRAFWQLSRTVAAAPADGQSPGAPR